MKKTLLTLLITILHLLIIDAQELYDINILRTLNIQFLHDDYHELLLDEWFEESGIRVPARVTMEGVQYDSVGIRYKGNSTFFVPNEFNNRKLPLNLDTDEWIDGQEILGFSKIKLANDYFDPSMVREVLAYDIYGNYMPSPRANYMKVNLDDEYLGLYVNTESINKAFLRNRFGSDSGAFFKCEPLGQFGVEENEQGPDLRWLGPDSTAYMRAYELKSNHGWAELLELIDILDRRPDEAATVLNVDRALWNLAVSTAIANFDSYGGFYVHNYYLYQNENGLWEMIPWDLSESWIGAIPNNNIIEWDPFGSDINPNESRTLLNLINTNPMYKKQYVAHIHTVINEMLDDLQFETRARALHGSISLAMLGDINALFGWGSLLFGNSLDDTTILGDLEVPAVIPTAKARKEFLLSLPELQASRPEINNVQQNIISPKDGDLVFITAALTNTDQVDLMVTKNKYASHFEAIPMLDDGAHGDGPANDGVYGAAIPFSNTLDHIKYYIRAQNAQAMKLSPIRAEHEFYEYVVQENTANMLGDLVINEFMTSNDITAADQDGEFDDWIELYNNSEDAIDLSGYFLSDDSEDLTKYEFPDGTTLASDSYLIIWADNDEEQEGLHANWKLSSSGEKILLADADTIVLDQLIYEEQTTDLSSARIPNGTGDFVIGAPTFGTNNDISSRSDDVDFTKSKINIAPNPASRYIKVSLDHQDGTIHELQIHNIDGKLLKRINTPNREHVVSVEDLPEGTYLVKSNKKRVFKFVINR